MSQALPPGVNWARILRLFKPDPQTLRFLGLALILPALFVCCLLTLILLTGPNQSELSNTEVLLLLTGFFLLPLLALLFGLAGGREPRHPPRMLLWLASALFFFSAGLLVATLMFLDPEMEKLVPVVSFLLFILPVVVILTLPAVYSLARTAPEVRALLKSAADERALAYILARDRVSFTELSQILDLPRSEVDNQVDGLLRSGALAGMLDVEHGLVYTATYLAEQQRQMLEQINLRGHLRLEELARLMKTSPATVKDWLYQLVQRGQFGGYLNWDKGVVYAATGKKIGVESRCPACGGTLVPGGGQRIVCLHCGVELWERD